MRDAHDIDGMEFPGIEHPARWIHAHLRGLWTSWPGRVLLGLTAAAGVLALVAGCPPGPAVSTHPWLDALLGLAVMWLASAAHELAHAVALVGYGRRRPLTHWSSRKTAWVTTTCSTWRCCWQR